MTLKLVLFIRNWVRWPPEYNLCIQGRVHETRFGFQDLVLSGTFEAV